MSEHPRQVDSAQSPRHASILLAAATLALGLLPSVAAATNAIVVENALPGSPASEWEVAGAGDPSIQGFATDLSVDQGATVEFKIKTDATSYRIDVYRLGWYGGNGARLVASVLPSVPLPQAQPSGLFDPATRLLDCGNWSVSASWSVPAEATSGIYVAKLVRTDPEDGRASHIAFVVRDDDGGSAILLQTSDTTWQAYNRYGEDGLQSGNSLYTGPGGKASKVSYNRPFTTRGGEVEDWVFNAEFPMVRWLERNGYDVSYSTGVDTDRHGAELLEHQIFVSIGHDEYWSRGARESVEAARDAGVHLAFLSGNEMYWKVRWEPSADGSGTPYRTMVCYKEGTLGENQCGTKCDPLPDVWTGLWRSGCEWTPPADGCEPENALTGNISWVGSTGSILVPSIYGRMPFWRNTTIASLPPGQAATLPGSTLGYEWDFQQYDAFYPPGRVGLSETVLEGKTHRLSLYRHLPSGALVFGAGTVQWSWGLDDVHDRAGEAPDPRMQQATVNLFADMDVAPETLQGGLVHTVLPPDSDAPTSTIALPSPGAVVTSGASTVISGTASDPNSGTVVLVEVSTDDGATWRPASGDESWTFLWTPGAPGPVTLRSRAWDASLHAETPGPGVPVTIEPSTCPCSLWNFAAVPGTPSENDASAVELGVKIRSDVDGYVTAIRFYKGTQNVGPHVGHLWSAGGTLLGSATFAGETALGWQEAPLDAPVAISANTTYVASYHTSTGYYASDVGYFSNAGHDASPLHALANDTDGPNGVYVYGASGFPTDTYNATNYWVDVVFDSTVTDTTPPSVVLQVPAPGAVAVSVGSHVSVTFQEPVQEASIAFALVDAFDAAVPATLLYDAPSRTATLDPASDLATSATYTARLTAVLDLAGNALAAPVAWSFTTQDPPPLPPEEGPGGPILVVADPADRFGRYVAEILRTEGLNEFDAVDLDEVDEPLLAAHSVVILGRATLDAARVALLESWVTGGGNLIALRPDPQLAGLLGLTAAGGTLSDGYLKLETAAPPGAGMVGESIQFHGTADLWTPNGATPLAMLWGNATTPTAHMAVSLRSVGSNGGQAAAFAYDLARSVVLTRQGNPAWASQERDGIAPMRSDDLFYGAAAGDPQLDWVNLAKVAIPQADEQQRFLANLILLMNADRAPLPRFWYLPDGRKAVVVLTGDDHTGSTRERFVQYQGASPSGCGVDDWECVRATTYLYPGNPMTDAEAAAFHAQGFEIGVHLNTGCANWTPASLDAYYTTQLAAIAAQYPSVPASPTQRHHCITWSDWATAPAIERSHGIRLDTNYYYWPPSWVQNRPGVFTGSALPMRFADLDGTMIDVYQLATQMTDESGQSYPFTIDTLLDRALGAEGCYGAFCANMHNDVPSSPGANAIIASAQARNVAIVSSRQLLNWVDARNASSFAEIAWSAHVLTFDVVKSPSARGLEAMIPATVGAATLALLQRNAVPVAWRAETIKGVAYAIFPAENGSWQATYDVDAAMPVITGVGAIESEGGAALVTWTTNEPADSRVDWGVDPEALGSSATSAAFVTSHQVTLTGLAPQTTYFYRVRSVDAAANAATEPPPPAAPLAFFTAAAPCAVEATAGDFGQGAFAGVLLSQTADGEIILAPSGGSELEGTSLPPGWAAFAWTPGGGVTVGGGSMSVDGARVRDPSDLGPGVSVELVATFAAGAGNAFQHVGFASGADLPPGELFGTSPWAIFSTGVGGGTLLARVWAGGPFLDFTIPGSWLGAPHRYRIDWNPTSVSFFIDDVVVHSQTVAITGPMRVGASDYDANGVALAVDWVRVAPYTETGTYTSRPFDAGGPASWGTATWSANVPPGTTLAIDVHGGDVPEPDGTWSAWTAVPGSGSAVGVSARYLQYRASLATVEPFVTPALHSLSLSCETSTDATVVSLLPPRVTRLHEAAPNPFPGTTRLSFDLARRGRVRLRIFAVDGRLVRDLVNGERAEGRYSVTWDGTDGAGQRVASSFYFATFESPGYRKTRKLLMLR